MTTLRNKKISQIINKIPHLTSKAYRLLSDRIHKRKEPILASYPFLGLLHKRSPSYSWSLGRVRINEHFLFN